MCFFFHFVAEILDKKTATAGLQPTGGLITLTASVSICIYHCEVLFYSYNLARMKQRSLINCWHGAGLHFGWSWASCVPLFQVFMLNFAKLASASYSHRFILLLNKKIIDIYHIHPKCQAIPSLECLNMCTCYLLHSLSSLLLNMLATLQMQYYITPQRNWSENPAAPKYDEWRVWGIGKCILVYTRRPLC